MERKNRWVNYIGWTDGTKGLTRTEEQRNRGRTDKMEIKRESQKRSKCSKCGSIKTVLMVDIEQPTDGSWRADLNCGKCGHNIYKFGI